MCYVVAEQVDVSKVNEQREMYENTNEQRPPGKWEHDGSSSLFAQDLYNNVYVWCKSMPTQ